MSVLDRAKAHFESKDIKRIEIPEWKDEHGNPTVLLAEPMSLEDNRTLRKAAQEDDNDFIVRMIILKALNEDGTKAFDLSDKPTLLRKVDPAILLRIGNMIYGSESTEEMAGN